MVVINLLITPAYHVFIGGNSRKIQLNFIPCQELIGLWKFSRLTDAILSHGDDVIAKPIENCLVFFFKQREKDYGRESFKMLMLKKSV